MSSVALPRTHVASCMQPRDPLPASASSTRWMRGYNLVQQCGPKTLLPLLVFIWLRNTPGSEGAGENLCAGRPHAAMFHFNLPALLPSLGDCFLFLLLLFPQHPLLFQTNFLSLFLVAVLPVSLEYPPILLFLPPLMLGKIPSSVLDVNYFQTNHL